MGHNLQWFIDRIGKRIYRGETTCPCDVCKGVHKHGLVISDKLHARYLYDCQNEMQIEYSDVHESVNEYKK